MDRNTTIGKPPKNPNDTLAAVTCILFAAFSLTLGGSAASSGLLQSLILFGCIRGMWPGSFFPRIAVVLIAVLIYWFTKSHFKTNPYLFGVFQGLFLLFSARHEHPGPVLRISSFILIIPFLVRSLPTGPSIAISLGGALLGLSLAIANYSGMSARSAIWWFLKRSLRKESIFVLAMVVGLTTLGLQRMRDGSGLNSGVSGLSSEVSPGAIQRLALSDAIAMRIEFNTMPNFDPSQAYFRSMALEMPEKFSWKHQPGRIRGPIPSEPTDLSYSASLSPRYDEFVPMLDYSVFMAQRGDKTSYGRSNGVFFPIISQTGWIRFSGRSRAQNPIGLSNEDRTLLVKVPQNLDSRVLAFSKSLTDHSDTDKFLANWTRHITSADFVYTLTPGEGSTSVEDFLFETKAGYCEHFASTTAILARGAGIPARVVSGFLGGIWKPQGRTLIIRDLDAHAWTEIWDVKKQIWVRYDPVTYIAPERLQLGSEDWLRSIGAPLPLKWASEQSLLFAGILMQLEELFVWMKSDLTDQFAEIMVNFSEEISLVGLVGLLSSYLWLLVKKRSQKIQDKNFQFLRQMERKFRRSDLARNPGETPLAWFYRLATHSPKYHDQVTQFADLYMNFAYGEKHGKEQLTNLQILARILAKSILKDPR